MAGGVYQIAAVRPGCTSVLSAPIRFLKGERLTIRVPIAVNGDHRHQIGVLEHVKPDQNAAQTVDALQQNSAAAGLDSRRSSGLGLQFDREELEKSNATTVGEFLQSVPGFTVRDPNSTASMRLSRNGGPLGGTSRALATASCHIGWFLDGRRIDLPGGRMDPLTDGLGTMPLEGLSALEVFRGVSEIPAEFSAPDLRAAPWRFGPGADLGVLGRGRRFR